MRAIVTGVAGFIGSHVAEHLIASGWEVLGIDDLSGGTEENVPAGVRFLKRDCSQILDDLFADFRPTTVYHLAAYAAEGLSHHIPSFNYHNNVVATANVLTASHRVGVKHFVFTSSIAAYGHPPTDKPLQESDPCVPCDPYGTAKLACEHHIRSFFRYFGSPTFTIFRPHNVYGPRQNVSDPYRNVVGIFIRCALMGDPLPVFGDGKQSRSFSHVQPVARCIAESSWTDAAKNETFNVGADDPLTVIDLANQILEITDAAATIEFLPSRNEVVHAHAAHDKVRAAFPEAFRDTIGLTEGLRETIDYVSQRVIPEPTECPSPIEIADRLPPSWKQRLGIED